MVTQHPDSIKVEYSLLRQIEIKENQLKIAQEFNMIYVSTSLQNQLLNLQSRLLELQNPQFEALMSLLDD